MLIDYYLLFGVCV